MVKKSLGNLLRYLVGDKLSNWDLVLVQVEFAYNNSVNRSIERHLLRLLLECSLEEYQI